MEVIRAPLKQITSPSPRHVAFQRLSSPAVINPDGSQTRYFDLLKSSLRVSQALERHAPSPRLSSSTLNNSSNGAHSNGNGSASVHSADGPRVAIMAEPSASFVAGTMGTWLHRGIAVPLCLSHPDRALQYVLEDAGVSAVLASEPHAERMYRLSHSFGATVHVLDPLMVQHSMHSRSNGNGALESAGPAALPLDALGAWQLLQEVEARLAGVAEGDGALIIYTSGTTGNPKGVLHTHCSVGAQVDTLCAAWGWAPSDRILHALPLHHIHGLVNALLCALRSGAAVEFMPKFSPGEAWQRLTREENPVTLFMAVPTMYSFLLHSYDRLGPEAQGVARAAAGRLRLAVSGSSACPLPVMARWEELSGQRLLERYGMSETGMVLGNPLTGERRPGSMGQPFPGLEVRLRGKPGDPPGVGEVLVRGAQLFDRYWGRPEATEEAFTEEGWFQTGDIAEVGGDPPYYSLLGRSSVDIIKHGGYKLSALQIESALLEHPDLLECAVVGLPDTDYGESVCAVVALKPGAPALDVRGLRHWAADRLAKYQMPSKLVVLEALPRNAMGKVNKKDLARMVLEHKAGTQPAVAV